MVFGLLKKLKLSMALAAVSFAFSSAAVAATITIGDLSWDPDADVDIVSSDGTAYLNWAAVAGFSYGEVLAATASGGQYQDYHIATQNEAFDFFRSATHRADAVDTPGLNVYFTWKLQYTSDMFGITGKTWNYAAFVSDEGDGVGRIYFSEDDEHFEIQDDPISTDFYDTYKHIYDNFSTTYFLVRNSGNVEMAGTPIEVPEPATAALMALGLLGLGAARRKQKRA